MPMSLPRIPRGGRSAIRATTAVLITLSLPAVLALARAQDIPAENLIMPAIVSEAFTGDLPEIRKRGVLRALVSFSRTDFFLVEGGRPRGITPELFQQLEKVLNKGLKKRALHTRVHYVIVPFNRLIPDLVAGIGDIAAHFLTITPEREKIVEFATGKKTPIDEVLVTHDSVAGISSLDDLSGRVVHVLNGSSYAEHLRQLNERLSRAGKAPVEIHEADPHLATEDILELVNAGVMEMTVADDFRAALWAKVLPDIVVHDEVKVNESGFVGWAVRQGNPELLKTLNNFSATVRRGTTVGNVILKRYFLNTKWIKNPIAESERKKLKAVAELFKKYAERYEFDWLALIAQAYQESRLDHSTKSRTGAVGIMQVLPTTAKDPNVAIPDIYKLENNIHAGTKYLAFLRKQYFDDPALAPADRLAFTWAAYNAGPASVNQMRRRAEEMGLDPNQWFGNVELAALAMVGQEPVRYVGNIYKYYVAYKTILAAREAKEDQKEAAKAGG